MRFIILPFLLFSFLTSFAQESDRKGYFNKTKVGILIRLNESPAQTGFSKDGSGTEISTINGWNFSSHLAAGIGIGISTYVNPTITTIPVYADVHYYFRNTRKTPYVFTDIGYGIITNGRREGDLLCDVGAGWTLRLGKKLNLTPEIAYRHQAYNIPYTGNNSKADAEINSVSVGVGILF